MKHNVYCVKDTLVGLCMPPVTGDSDPAMIRSFGDSVLKGDTPISAHPEDYCLLKVGQFDSEFGLLIPYDAPVVLCHASDFKKKEVTNE